MKGQAPPEVLARKWVYTLETTPLPLSSGNKQETRQAEPVVCSLSREDLSDPRRRAYSEMALSGRRVLNLIVSSERQASK